MVPNDIERLVIQCATMRLREGEALRYLKANGHEVSRATYYRIKGRLQANKEERLNEIASVGFVDQHLERIDQLELIQQEMWKCYFKEKSPRKQAQILRWMAETQPYLSTYYELTKEIMKYNRPHEPVYQLPDFDDTREGRASRDEDEEP